MLQFDLSPLIGARAGERLVFTLDEEPQEFEDITVDSLRGDLTFTRVQDGILIQAKIESEIQVECDRCLESFSLPATLELEEIISISDKPDVTYSLTEEGWLDVSPLLREQAWLAIPIKALCTPDCRGLCPQCGANLNVEECDCSQEQVDPRLAVLASLLEEEQE